MSLQTKLNLKVSQRQILTPGLVQMVSVLALNKLELKDMINDEMVENPVLDEYEEVVPTLDEMGAREEQRERESAATTVEEQPQTTPEERDPFEEVDFGSFFNEYLDPGYRSNNEMESIEKPSFENFLSRPLTLTDHLMWQLGAMHIHEDVRAAAELMIGNLSDDGYLLASDEELLAMEVSPECEEPTDGEAPKNQARSALRRRCHPRGAQCPAAARSHWRCLARPARVPDGAVEGPGARPRRAWRRARYARGARRRHGDCR